MRSPFGLSIGEAAAKFQASAEKNLATGPSRASYYGLYSKFRSGSYVDSAVVLTPLHYVYLIGVLVILAVMILRKDTPAVCIAFFISSGVIGLGSVTGGIMTVFNSILFAAREFMKSSPP